MQAVMEKSMRKLQRNKSLDLQKEARVLQDVINAMLKKEAKKKDLNQRDRSILDTTLALEKSALTDAARLESQGVLDAAQIRELQAEIKDVEAIQDLEERENSINKKVTTLLIQLNNYLSNPTQYLNQIMYTINLYYRLEQAYVQLIQEQVRQIDSAKKHAKQRHAVAAARGSRSKRIAKSNALAGLEDDKQYQGLLRDAQLKNAADKAEHSTNLTTRLKQLVSSTVTAGSDTTAGLGKGTGAALEGSGKGVGAAAQGIGEGSGAAARGSGKAVEGASTGTGEAANGVGSAIGAAGQAIARMFSRR